MDAVQSNSGLPSDMGSKRARNISSGKRLGNSVATMPRVSRPTD